MRKYLFALTLMACLDAPATAIDDTSTGNQANHQVQFDTPFGNFIVEVYPQQAPISSAHFLQLVDRKFFEGSQFYVAMRPDNTPVFERQPGQYTKVGPGGILVGGFVKAPENSDVQSIAHESTQDTGLSHTHGALSWGRYPDGRADTALLLTVGDQPDFDHDGLINPDGRGYAVFGKVIAGMAIVEKMLAQPTTGTFKEDFIVPYAAQTATANTSPEWQAQMKKSTLSSTIPIVKTSRLSNNDQTATDRLGTYSPYTGHNAMTQVYWGDTHLHSNISFDGYPNNPLGWDEAYQFAQGQPVTTQEGKQVRLKRPLDFLVIADHALNYGVLNGLAQQHTDLLATDTGRDWHRRLAPVLNGDNSNGWGDEQMWLDFMTTRIDNPPYRRSIWQAALAKAEQYNQPGHFTALIGFEWSSSLTDNLASGYRHRVVIFADGADKAGQVVPFSRFDSLDPEDLWAYLADYEQLTGGKAIAIPHNGNLSAGGMFAATNETGQPLSADYAKTRAHWEPLYEVTQLKGDSETHPLLSPQDDFANYETWGWWKQGPNEGQDLNQQRQQEYARSALKLGLQHQQQLQVNPFKFGLIGSSDSHTSMSAMAEDNFWGSITPNAQRAKKQGTAFGVPYQWNAAGYAAVWAEENTREALFAAMKRKEVYASTGPRITLRFFGGWDYQPDDAYQSGLAQIGYAKGVPMGGDLMQAPRGKSPRFLIRAVKDPDGANLDRVQVIKGWLDKNGKLQEKIYNVALSDGRREDHQGKVKPVGSSVDIANASYTNSIGDPELAVVWQDPDFNPDDLAFYYLRVLEIPTPRWPTYDAKYFGIQEVPEELTMVTQERAYTSPIWYTPNTP